MIKEELPKGNSSSAAPVSMAASLMAHASIKNKVETRFQVILVYINNNVTRPYRTTLCFLDSGADGHLIDKELYSDLNLTGRPMWSDLQMANGELQQLDSSL